LIENHQSEEGSGFGSSRFISSPQQVKVPSPALVQRTSVPHFSHLYLFPSWLIDSNSFQVAAVHYCFISMG
jgi:hypothetical protein